jgi:hypothetical protein
VDGSLPDTLTTTRTTTSEPCVSEVSNWDRALTDRQGRRSGRHVGNCGTSRKFAPSASGVLRSLTAAPMIEPVEDRSV